jgi:hypothetical protein
MISNAGTRRGIGQTGRLLKNVRIVTRVFIHGLVLIFKDGASRREFDNQ